MATGAGAGGRSRGLRVFAFAFALLQIALQGVFAVSDGYAERASSHVAPMHAEMPGNTHHRPHDDDCVVCHVLASGADVPPRAPSLWPGEDRVAATPSAVRGGRPYTIIAGAPRARAPPSSV